jgi:tetratricopeptide (TPR) repeat protein
MKKIGSIRLLLIVPLAITIGNSCSTGPSPKDVVSKYLDGTLHGKYEQAYSHLSSEDKKIMSLDEFSKNEGADNPFKVILSDKVFFQIKEVKTAGDKGEAVVEITSPDLRPLFREMFGAAIAAAFTKRKHDDNALNEALADKIKGKDLPTTTVTEAYDLVKEKDGWKVFLNLEGLAKSEELKKKASVLEKQKQFAEAKAALQEATKFNPKDKEIAEKIKEVDKEAEEYKEKQDYFPYIEVRNVHVAKTILDDYGVFGEIKNRGNRTLKKVEITAYCLDKEGNVVYEKRYHPVLVTEFSLRDSQPLKPNYGKTFGYRIDNAPSDWAKKARVAVTDVEFQ